MVSAKGAEVSMVHGSLNLGIAVTRGAPEALFEGGTSFSQSRRVSCIDHRRVCLHDSAFSSLCTCDVETLAFASMCTRDVETLDSAFAYFMFT